MPFQIKINFLEKWAFNRIKRKFPEVIDYANSLSLDGTYNWIGFENLLKEKNINFSPLKFLFLVKPIPYIVAKNILSYDDKRIDKVKYDDRPHGNSTFDKKFKFDRNSKDFKIVKSDFITYLEKLKKSYKILYIKFGVDKVEDKENEKEDFKIYIGGLNDYVDYNSSDFVDIENIGTQYSKQSVKTRNSNFKEKHKILFDTNYYLEFKECADAGGLIHDINETIVWVNSQISKKHFYIHIGCDYTFNYKVGRDTFKNTPDFLTPCSNNNLTTAIFTESPNRNIGPLGIIESLLNILQIRTFTYGDKGGGCCP